MHNTEAGGQKPDARIVEIGKADFFYLVIHKKTGFMCLA